MKNPYPETAMDETSGVVYHTDKHIYWQEGYDAKEKEAQDLYEALKEALESLADRDCSDIEFDLRRALAKVEK